MSAPARLTYFKGRGLAEQIRFMLAETGTEYEERTITTPLLKQLRQDGELFFQQLPLLEVDGLKLVQSAAIMRYLARKHDMYGSNAIEAYQCDMIADGLADLRKSFTSFDNYRQRKLDEAGYLAQVGRLLPRYLKPLEEMLKTNNGGEKKVFLLGEKITYTDVSLVEVLEHVKENFPGVLEKEYPYLSSFLQRTLERPGLKAHYAAGRRNVAINDEYIAHVDEVFERK